MKPMDFKRVIHVLLFSVILFSSCSSSKKLKNSINLSDSFYFLDAGTEPGTIEQIQTRNEEFQKLEYWGHHNISNIAGNTGNYVWLKADFYLPESLKDEDISFFVSYIHFAEKTYSNGDLIGESGSFPDSNGKGEVSSMYETHLYRLNNNLLNKKGKNAIYIQVYSKGNAECSGYCLIGPTKELTALSTVNNFWSNKLYLLLVCNPIITFILFITLFITSRKNRSWNNYFFAMECIASTGIYAYFFATDIPLYVSSGISHLWFTKLFLCVCSILFAHFVSLFSINFINGKIPKKVNYTQTITLIFILALVFSSPNLPFLMKVTIPGIFIIVFKFGISIYFIFRGLRIKEQRTKAIITLIAFTPLYFSILFDAIIHLLVDYSMVSYFTILGQIISSLVFIVILCININKATDENIYLNENLQREIELQTVDLTFANERLEQENKRAEKDLEMASVIQKNFLIQENHQIEGWELAILYEPLSKVSGDLYDYYCDGNKLNGFSIFDVSGHGVAASLVTMLSKNIIFKNFRNSLKNGNSVSQTLLEINDSINNAKGNIENYLTGLLFRIFDEKNGISRIQLASGGHPYPIWYSTQKDDIELILIDPSQEQKGAIGIKNVEVSYPDIDIELKTNDILVSFTDGLIESCNQYNEQFGRERVEQIIKENHNLSADEIKKKLINSLNAFMEENPRDDDITIIVLKKK